MFFGVFFVIFIIEELKFCKISQLCFVNITRWRKGNTMPLMLFSEDFIYHGERAHSGCAFEDGACNSQYSSNGETWGVVDLTYYTDNEEQRAEKAARTLAHELGHMVST